MTKVQTLDDVYTAARLLRTAGWDVFIDTYDLRVVAEAMRCGAGEEAALILAAGEFARALWDGRSIPRWKKLTEKVERMLRAAVDLAN